VPEAIGEILAVRPELREAFLPMLCSLVTDQDMHQTGAIERGALWALGRVGPPVTRCSPEAVEALRAASAAHPDRETREIAARSLALLANADTAP
jgi:HEAT repeat protein